MKEIYLKHYAPILEILKNKELDSLEQWIEILKVIGYERPEAFSIGKFEHLVEHYNKVLSTAEQETAGEVWINGEKWKVDSQILFVPVSFYKDFVNISKYASDNPHYLHNLMSMVLYRETDSDEYTTERHLRNYESVGELPLEYCLKIANFFFQILNLLRKNTQDSLEIQKQKKQKDEE